LMPDSDAKRALQTALVKEDYPTLRTLIEKELKGTNVNIAAHIGSNSGESYDYAYRNALLNAQNEMRSSFISMKSRATKTRNPDTNSVTSTYTPKRVRKVYNTRGEGVGGSRKLRRTRRKSKQ